MPIDKVRLPAILHESLFKNHLIDCKKMNDDETSTITETKINFLGSNEKKITFLINDRRNKFLADTQMKFLSDLLMACYLNMADIAIVNIHHNQKITYRELADQLHSGKILLFGVSAADLDLPFTIPFFQVQNFHEKIYMISPPLEEIQMDKELKKQLWLCLQKIFNLQK